MLKKLRLRIETEEKDQQNSTAMENHPERYPNLDIYCVIDDAYSLEVFIHQVINLMNLGNQFRDWIEGFKTVLNI